MKNTANLVPFNPPKVIPQAELQRCLQTFKEERCAEFHLTALGYFGSYARQEARPDSDVDIIFQTSQPNFFTTALMKQELEQWLNCSVDIIRFHSYLHPTFRDRIDREAIYV